MTPKKPKRKPQDATLRNVRAANKKIAVLEENLRLAHSLIGDLHIEVGQLQGSLEGLFPKQKFAWTEKRK